MKHALSYHDYLEVCSLAEQKDEKYFKQYLSAIDSLFTHWTNTLGHDKVCVLGFILSRTLKYGKAVAGIPFPAFLGGVTSERCETAITSALKISKNTLRNILKELIEDGFLHAFFPEKRRGIVDTFTRYFEIDVKKLQKLRNVGSEIMGILRQPKPKTIADQASRKVNSRLPKLGDLSIHTHVLDKSNTARVASRQDREEQLPTPAIKRILRTRPIEPTPAPTPVAEPAPRETSQQIMARMDALQSAAKQRREDKIKGAKGVKPAAIKQDQLQAVVDKAMTKYHPDLPRLVVTGKAFGAMKNHLKRSAPADIVEFVEWTLRSWRELAVSHAKSARKNLGDATRKQYDAISSAPNFAAFGYRLPFFLACYNNRMTQDSALGTQEQRDLEAIAKAQRAATAAKQENASLRALLRKQHEERRGTTERRDPPRVDDTERSSGYDDSLGQDDLQAWK